MAFRLILVLAAASCIAATGRPLVSDVYHPNPKAAEHNSFALFNSIHSAMRQFGSSVHHNDLSFYLAQAPEGSIFYHGDLCSETPKRLEWLAFEIEHAAVFAESWEPMKNANVSEYTTDPLLQHKMSRQFQSAFQEPDHLQIQATSQQPLLGISDDSDERPRNPREVPGRVKDPSKPARGYFHTYVANRPLNLLYIGGQSAAKGEIGAMDSQDLILLEGINDEQPRPFPADLSRAADMCALAKEWTFEVGGKIDGFVRVEAGFEIIYCDFFDGLDLLSVQASSFPNETGIQYDEPIDIWPEVDAETLDFEWLRAVAARFHGHPAGRLEVDWSSMVSAFAYPVNVSNPDWNRQDLPRLVNATRKDRQIIRSRLRQIVAQRGGRTVSEKDVVDWQSVVDKIVTRFSKRLWWMGNTELSLKEFIPEIGTLLNPFIDYLDHSQDSEQLAIDRCAQHYVDPRLLRSEFWTPEDHAIAAAIGAVSKTICTSLFSARKILRSNTTTAGFESAAPEKARGIIQDLMSELRWSPWRECGKCEVDEICSIPMFPLGSKEDYFHPRCKNATEMRSSFGYWAMK